VLGRAPSLEQSSDEVLSWLSVMIEGYIVQQMPLLPHYLLPH